MRPLAAALLTLVALAAAGCDTGGLLLVEHKKPVANGPSVNEMVSGGNFATNGKYRLFHTLGQPTPNQGIGASADSQLKGGLVGASQGD